MTEQDLMILLTVAWVLFTEVGLSVLGIVIYKKWRKNND